MNDQDELLKLTNTSGFVFQIGVRHEIERTFQNHGWTVAVEEHHWRHPETGQSGFIDLVVRNIPRVIVRIVIECKRATDQKWIFLVPEDEFEPVATSSVFLSARAQENQDVWAWLTDDIEPRSVEAGFCIVRGQGDKNSPMLERVADILLPSVEAVAIEEMSLEPHSPIGTNALYLPVIVTNARLYSCLFDPADVGMDSGKLSGAKFTEEKMLRFRKNLITGFKDEEKHRDLVEANRQKQRSIWVVNSSHLSEILAGFVTSPRLGSILSALIRSERHRKHGNSTTRST
jgi:hypothetical protein